MADKKSNQTVAQRAFGPAAERFGKEVAPLGTELGIVSARVGRLLISGLQKSVYGFEQVGAWIEKSVSERLKNIPVDKIVEPDARIAAPATQALIYSMTDEVIREMFANLLASDMNADEKEKVHPAFVEMIKEMTRTDAEILLQMPQGWQEIGYTFSFEVAGINSFKIRKSISNLRRLEVVDTRQNEWVVREDLGDRETAFRAQFAPLINGINSSEAIKQAMKMQGDVGLSVARTGLYLTPLGTDFAAICLPR